MSAFRRPDMGVRSPRSGHTIKSLSALKESGFHNPDTGVELAHDEAMDHLHKLYQNRADKLTAKMIRSASSVKLRSRGRPMIPHGRVVFRRINGHVVPFFKAEEPSL